MSSGSGTETVTQNSEPWSQSQPYLQDIFRNAQNQYRQGAEYYPGSTVVPFSPTTQQGMSGLQDHFSATNPVGYDQAMGAVSSVAGSNQNNPHVSNIQNAGAAQNTAGTGVFNDFAQNGVNNPFLDAQFDRAAERVRDNTAAMFSKAGRYGSVAHQDQLSDSLGDMATNFYGQAYNQDQNRRFGAAQQLAGMQQGDLARNLSGATAAAGVGQNANQQALQAATMFPALNSYAQANDRGMLELGAMQEGKAAQHLQDSMDRWNFGQNAGWDLLSRYNQTIQPIAAMGGSSTQTGPRAQSGFGAALQGGLGTGLAAAAIPGVGPMAAIGLGGLGALGSLF